MSRVKLVRSVWISSALALFGCSDDPSGVGPQTIAGAAAPPAAGAAGLGPVTAGVAANGGSAGAAAVSGGSAGAPAPSGASGSTGAAATSGSAAGGSAAVSGSAGSAAIGGISSTPSAGATAPAPSGAPTFTRVWNEILMLKGCSGQYCHGSGMGGLGLKNKREAYDNLVNVPAAGPACAAKGGVRVKPMDPAASLLLDKISHLTPSCGDVMPIGTKLAPNCVSPMPQVCTTEQELGLVREWILAGARDD